MSSDPQSARDDLAFLRGLIESSESLLSGFGETYFAAGLIFGAQMLLSAVQLMGLAPNGGLATLVVGFGPTLLFFPVLFWINWRHRNDRPPTAVGRAITTVFSAMGMANLVLACVIGSVAWREHSLTVWFIFPCVVFVLQGASWFIATLLRRRVWMGAVAGGWFAAAIAMAASVQSVGYYVLFAGLGIWGCMALPGWVVMSLTRKAVALAPAAA